MQRVLSTESPSADQAGPPVETLSRFQMETISLFVHAAAALSLPRSIGEIYGLLYGTERSLALDDVVALLHISRGSASQGLRWLRDMGAIRAVYTTGMRREHYVAETELRRLASAFVREQVEPHLENGRDWIQTLESAAREGGDGEFAESRIDKLRRWHSLMERVLPMFKALAADI